MIELKATTAQEIVRNEKDCDYMDELFGGVKMHPTQVYIKSEADKVIEEKDKEISDLEESHKKEVGQLLIEIAELKAQKAQAEDDCAYWKMREGNAVNAMHETEEACMCLTKSERHHKYKRCLAMAAMCKARYDEEDAKVNGRGASWDYISDEMKYWERWRDRWLELAEKFKDKETK